ncbi:MULTISPECIES: hypothetical protein [unclassified Vibrio]|uniref:hypothetical protein n=1 Tax=unclassified Vibrio TaxID=2614977 RepID=UPI001EF0EEB7|nr:MULTISPECIES: hypothetical protein [unclassified Vibrio]
MTKSATIRPGIVCGRMGMTDLDIELEHILLEIRAERWNQLDRFLFPYFCFREGYLTKQGKPDWEAARAQSPRSSKIMQVKHACLEPLLPNEALIGELKRHTRDGNLSLASLKRILATALQYAVISKEEKQALSSLGLADAMPPEWYRSAERTIHARFDAANIKIN